MSDPGNLWAKPYMVSPSIIEEWFKLALDNDDPKPSLEGCLRLARDAQIIANRHNNDLVERQHRADGMKELPIVPLDGMADVSPLEWEKRKIDNVALKAARVLADINDLRHALDLVDEYSGDFKWNNALSLEGLRSSIAEFVPWLYGVGGTESYWHQHNKVNRGRPRSQWHTLGRDIGVAIAKTLADAGYSRRLSLQSEESPVVFVGTNVVNWLFDLTIDPSGFASAMRDRDRRQT